MPGRSFLLPVGCSGLLVGGGGIENLNVTDGMGTAEGPEMRNFEIHALPRFPMFQIHIQIDGNLIFFFDKDTRQKTAADIGAVQDLLLADHFRQAICPARVWKQ